MIFVSNILVICVYFKIYFLLDKHCKTQSELTDRPMLKNGPCRVHEMNLIFVSVSQASD